MRIRAMWIDAGVGARRCAGRQASGTNLPPLPEQDEYDEDEPDGIGEPPQPIPVPPAPPPAPLQLCR